MNEPAAAPHDRPPFGSARALGLLLVLISTLYLMFLAVSVIDFCLNFTGLSGFVARDVLNLLRAFAAELQAGGLMRLLALFVTMLLAILLGMGMPTVPAYINVALLMGPMIVGLGIATFTAHMFVFFSRWPRRSPRRWRSRRSPPRRSPGPTPWPPASRRCAPAS